MTAENISWSISTKECCRPWRALNPRPPGLQSDGASNWATEAGSTASVLYLDHMPYGTFQGLLTFVIFLAHLAMQRSTYVMPCVNAYVHMDCLYPYIYACICVCGHVALDKREYQLNIFILFEFHMKTYFMVLIRSISSCHLFWCYIIMFRKKIDMLVACSSAYAR